jgi:hypothetical protein
MLRLRLHLSSTLAGVCCLSATGPSQKKSPAVAAPCHIQAERAGRYGARRRGGGVRAGWRRHLRCSAPSWHRQRGHAVRVRPSATRRRGPPRPATQQPQEALGEAAWEPTIAAAKAPEPRPEPPKAPEAMPIRSTTRRPVGPFPDLIKRIADRAEGKPVATELPTREREERPVQKRASKRK